MPRLANFIYCLNAERIQNSDGKGEVTNAMGVLSTMIPEFVPGMYSFSVIFSILNMDASIENEIQLLFSKVGSKEPLVDTGVVKLSPVSDKDEVIVPDYYKGLNLSFDFRNLVFEEEGAYETRIIFNQEDLGAVSIYVKGRR